MEIVPLKGAIIIEPEVLSDKIGKIHMTEKPVRGPVTQAIVIEVPEEHRMLSSDGYKCRVEVGDIIFFKTVHMNALEFTDNDWHVLEEEHILAKSPKKTKKKTKKTSK